MRLETQYYYVGSEEYCTITETAKRLKVHRQTIVRRFNDGKIPGALDRTTGANWTPILIPMKYVLTEERKQMILNKPYDAVAKECGAVLDIPVSERIANAREKSGLTQDEIGRLFGVSSALMDILEESGVTHPKIAKKIGKRFGLNELDIESIIPLNLRKHGGCYDPDKYRDLVDIYGFQSFDITNHEK